MPMHEDPDLRNPDWHERAYDRAIERHQREARAESDRHEAAAERWREAAAIQADIDDARMREDAADWRAGFTSAPCDNLAWIETHWTDLCLPS